MESKIEGKRGRKRTSWLKNSRCWKGLDFHNPFRRAQNREELNFKKKNYPKKLSPHLLKCHPEQYTPVATIVSLLNNLKTTTPD